jgi:hypothetical protein
MSLSDSSDDSEVKRLLQALPAAKRSKRKRGASPDKSKPVLSGSSLLQQALQDDVRSMQSHRAIRVTQALVSTNPLLPDDVEELKVSFKHTNWRMDWDTDEEDENDDHIENDDEFEVRRGTLFKKMRLQRQKVKQALQENKIVCIGTLPLIRASPIYPYNHLDDASRDLLEALGQESRFCSIVSATKNALEHGLLGTFLYEQRLYRYIKRVWDDVDPKDMSKSPLSSLGRCLLRLASSQGFVSSVEACEGARVTLLKLLHAYPTCFPKDLLPPWSAWLQGNDSQEYKSQLDNMKRHAALHSFQTALQVFRLQKTELGEDSDAELASLLILRLDTACHIGQFNLQEDVGDVISQYIQRQQTTEVESNGTRDDWCRNLTVSVFNKVEKLLTASSVSDPLLYYATVATLTPTPNCNTWTRLQAYFAEESLARCSEESLPSQLESFVQNFMDHERLKQLCQASLAWRSIVTSCLGLYILLQSTSAADFEKKGTLCLSTQECLALLLQTGLDLMTTTDDTSDYVLLVEVLDSWLTWQANVDQKIGPLSSQFEFQRTQYRLQVLRTLVNCTNDFLRRRAGLEEKELVQKEVTSYFRRSSRLNESLEEQDESQNSTITTPA